MRGAKSESVVAYQRWKRVPGKCKQEWGIKVCGVSYHDQNAMKKPMYEKKNTRPYLLTGLKTGIDRAFLL
jgi:hypothetical protein